MLTREKAQEALQQIQDSNWQAAALNALHRLDSPLREIGYMLLGYFEAGSPLALDKHREWIATHTYELHSLSSEKRLLLFQTLLPGIGTQVEGMWQLSQQLPYQLHYLRRAFRAAHHPDALQAQREHHLRAFLHMAGPYRNQDIHWFAMWAAHLHGYQDGLGLILAAAIEAGGEPGEAVFQTLLACGRGEHEIGVMGRQVARALLTASRPDGWEFMEKMLLAAQRQEGLRQVILETIDEAHPAAFARMLRLIVEHDLARFAATIRAVDVWLGYGYDAMSASTVNHTLKTLLDWFHRLDDIPALLESQEPATQYLMLWRLGFEEAVDAIPHAMRLLNHPAAETRFVATHFLAQLYLPEAYQALLPVLEDADLRVALRAWQGLTDYTAKNFLGNTDAFERVESLIARLPEKQKVLEPLVWGWMQMSADRTAAADSLLLALGERPVTRLVPYLTIMSANGRSSLARQLAHVKPRTPEIHHHLFRLLGDRSDMVRRVAFDALSKAVPDADEAAYLETLLVRKSADTRRHALQLLFRRDEQAVLESADRLLQSSLSPQRLGGLELLCQLSKTSRVFYQ